MKNFRLSALLCCVSLCGFAACSDDKTDDQPEPQAYQVTQFESSTIPASIPGEGGGDKLTFVIRTETRSTGATFEPWAYRLTLGDAVGDAVTVTKPTTEIAITIPPNRSKEERGVAVEMASGVKAETWTKIVEATQEGSLKDYQVTKFESTTIPATPSSSRRLFPRRFLPAAAITACCSGWRWRPVRLRRCSSHGSIA